MLTCGDCARGGGPSSRCFGSSPSAPSKLWMEFGSKAHTQRVPEKNQYRRECNSSFVFKVSQFLTVSKNQPINVTILKKKQTIVVCLNWVIIK